MGNKHVVAVWNPVEAVYNEVYRGDAFQEALEAFLKAKSKAYCVRWEWRP